MKVVCEKIANPDTGEVVQHDSWLTVGKTYHVLSVFMKESGDTEYRVIADDGVAPVMFKANQFKIVVPDLPDSWIANSKPGVYFELDPATWVEPGFWERYFDGEMEAVSCFELEFNKIVNQ